MITTSTAVFLAGHGAVLASRPRGVLHVHTGPLTPSGQFTPQNSRPVCGRRFRRLHVVPDLPSPELVGHHQNGQRMCARCQARLARASVERAGWATTLTSRAKVRRNELITDHTAGGEPWDVIVGDVAVGTVARCDETRWRVHSAGLGVPVNRQLKHPNRAAAVIALAIARELALLPGGPLEEVDGLTQLDRQILDFAGRTHFHAGKQERDIRHQLQMSPTRYFQRLNKLIDTAPAERYAPQTVHRRRRLRDHHRRRRHIPDLPASSLAV